MLIYNDIFSWDWPDTIQKKPTLWLRSCRLWIIDLSKSYPNVLHLKPVIVVASDINNGPKRKICAETLGKQIFSSFGLDIKRTLWVELDPSTQYKLMTAAFYPRYHDGNELIYSITWRRLLVNEEQIIRQYIPEINIDGD